MAVEETKHSEAQLQQIVDAMPQTVVLLKPDGNVIHANRMVIDYTGVFANEVTHSDFRDRVFHPREIEKFGEMRRNGFSGTVPWEQEVRVRRKDGVYRWFLIRYNPLFDERGGVFRWCAAGMDIEDRKRYEERLREENLVLREEVDRSSMYEEIVGSSVPSSKRGPV